MTVIALCEATGVALLLAAAAGSAEWRARGHPHPVRYVWLAAMLLGAALPRVAGWVLPVFGILHDSAVDAPFGAMVSLLPVDAIAPSIASSPWERAFTMAMRWSSLASAAGLVIVVGAEILVMQRVRRLPTAIVHGMTVRISPDLGPAVAGVVGTAVVLPRWTLSLGHASLSLILRHEREHLRARDPLVVFAGAVLVALQPWNLGMWLLFARLRTAIELDCDSRVLGDGRSRHAFAPADIRAYGHLLLDARLRTNGHAFAAIPFWGTTPALQRRLSRMTAPRLRRASSILATLASASSLGAGVLLSLAAGAQQPPAVTRPAKAPPQVVRVDSVRPPAAAAAPRRNATQSPPRVIRVVKPGQPPVVVHVEDSTPPKLKFVSAVEKPSKSAKPPKVAKPNVEKPATLDGYPKFERATKPAKRPPGR